MVAHRDRLARFGFDLIAFLVEHNGGEIVVLDQPLDQSREAERTADLLAILHQFAGGLHGRRSHQSQTDSALSDIGAEEPISAVARNLKIRLQRDRQASQSTKGTMGIALDGRGEDHPAEPAGLGRSDPVSDQEDRH